MSGSLLEKSTLVDALATSQGGSILHFKESVSGISHRMSQPQHQTGTAWPYSIPATPAAGYRRKNGPEHYPQESLSNHINRQSNTVQSTHHPTLIARRRRPIPTTPSYTHSHRPRPSHGHHHPSLNPSTTPLPSPQSQPPSLSTDSQPAL